jgi:hypothetical protein
MAVLDHLVVAARDLDSGVRWLEGLLGVALSPGGRHATMGTHNRLLRLGARTYLELIAVDPAQQAPHRPRWFGLDNPVVRERIAEQPQLIHWVAASEDTARDAALAGFAPDEILPMERGAFRWRITVPRDGRLPGGGLQPTLIQWDVPSHPADALPDTGCRLMKLEAFCAEPARFRHANAALGLAQAIDLQPLEPGAAAEWIAYLRTPAGLIELTGRPDVLDTQADSVG